ncbi:MAG: thiamine pyrophosphate-dependent enzyme [Candidatus Kapabacteria bacterium]|nr:thiamine pyrophosphate-dependent enzyme [Candidatus Kapabacteria bacterium]MDW8011540.1 thiamine pyrophosphate-dependent enzyme [Bacteroidota bacterium]
MHLGRRLDERAQYYLRIGKGWSYHAPFAGHDGIQLAIGVTFRPGKDFLFPYYRDLLTCLAAGITPEEIILNGLSKDTDVAGGGRHMSNHFAKPSIRIQNVSSTTGNHAQHAVGVARAIKKYGGDEIAIYSGGESACSEGFFYEAVNGASRERLPVIFVIQNNRYGISVPVTEQTANPDVSDNFVGFRHLKIIKCDGRNPFDSYRAMQAAREYVLSGAGPAMVHAECDRIGSHSNSDDHRLYRSPEEIEEVRRRDPLPRFRRTLIEYGIATEEEVRRIEDDNERVIREAAAKAEAAPDPDPDSWSLYILPEPLVGYEDTSEERYRNDPQQPQLTLREAINLTLKEEFRRNPNTFLWGQDVASKDKGGVFNVTKGMLQEFGGERVFNAPIAENFIVGTANGFCRYREDIWVVIEGAEFADYFWPAMDQLVECSHEYWRTKGQFVPNIVIRLATGNYIQGGLYHSQSIEGALVTLPGIRIVYPAFADDAVGLLRHALRSRGVTVFLEPKFLYNYRPAAAAKPPEDFIIPFGKAKIRRVGTDVTVVAYGTAVHWALQAAEEVAAEGISVEVVDLRSLAPWDKKTVLDSVRKTNRVIVAHEDKRTGGFGGEVAAVIAEEGFAYLDAPVVRLGSRDCPIGFAKSLEQAIMLQPSDIVQAIRRLVKY